MTTVMTPEEKHLARKLLTYKTELQMASLQATELAARQLAIISKERQKHDELEALQAEYAVLLADYELCTGFAYQGASEKHQSGPHSGEPSGSGDEKSNNPSTPFEREDSPGDAVQRHTAELGEWCLDPDELSRWQWHSWTDGALASKFAAETQRSFDSGKPRRSRWR